MNSNKFIYIDNLRTFIISLVLIYHLALFYMPFKWYCCTEVSDAVTLVFLTAFTTISQTFFMGLLFFISAYFTNQSFNKANNINSALTKRLIRLGIPVVVYLFTLSPLTYYLPILFSPNSTTPFPHIFNLGSLWFIAALLLFTLIYALFRFFVTFDFHKKQPTAIPNALWIIIFAFMLGILSFIIRIWFPVGDIMPITNAQFAHFPQYIALFILGIVAYRYQWLDAINFKSSIKWLLFALATILFSFLMLYFVGSRLASNGVTHEDIPYLLGEGHMLSLAYAIWEQLTGVPLMIGLLGLFKDYFDKQTQFSQWLAENSYAVYLTHLPIIVFLSLVMGQFDLPIYIKLLVLIVLSLIICFVSAYLIRQIPVVKKVL